MRAVDIIYKKRNNEILSEKEIKFFLSNYLSGDIPDYQMSALLMAFYFSGLSPIETQIFTQEMIHSGIIIDLSEITQIKVDKHSTGGVGDKVSLIAAPIVASCGVKIPMMSGRGLGHTGGTLDKLESIPGYQVFFKHDEIIKIIQNCNYIMMGQTNDIVPADKKLYSLRDVTATVESIPLITASIISKKYAEGANALVIDLKFGNGAFMKNVTQANALGSSLKRVGELLGLNISIALTNMDEPLGNSVGNYIEVLEAVDILRGNVDNNKNLIELSLTISSLMIILSNNSITFEEAYKLSMSKIKNGEALNYFLKNVKLQGGDMCYVEKNKLVIKYRKIIKATSSGYIQELNAYKIGLASMLIGAGRKNLNSIIDNNCGVYIFKKIGQKITNGEPILELLYNNSQNINESINLCKEAIKITNKQIQPTKIIEKIIY